ncbi:MAG: hypothetical protein WBA71_05355 [Candidatus Humimicrobiia bacterium]
MAEKSDQIIKNEFSEIGNINDLELRIFPVGSREDQKHWIEGGLSFGYNSIRYGSCDGAWYREEKWHDPLSKKVSLQKPILAVEGTLALERGSSGNAQYQRFFHALGAVLSGVIGIYYLRKGKDVLRYDLPKAALNVSEIHGTDYLVVTELDDIKELVESMAQNNQARFQKAVARIKSEMEKYFQVVFQKRFKGDIENYYRSRSIIRLPSGINIKYLAGNYRNFTESSQRGGHIVLGEFLMAKYFLRDPFYFLLPRLLQVEIRKLDDSNKKEWQILRNDKLGKLITLHNLKGISGNLKKDILSLKDQPLGGSAEGGRAKKTWNSLMKILEEGFRNGLTRI